MRIIKSKHLLEPILFILTALLLLCSCSEVGETSDISKRPSTVDNSVPSDTVSIIEMGPPIEANQQVHVDFSSIKEENKYVIAYYDDIFVVETDDATTERFYRFDIKTGQSKLIGSTPLLQLGAGSVVITANNRMYTSYQFENAQVNTFLEMDLDNLKLNTIATNSWWPPFQYYEVDEQNNVFCFGPKRLETENEVFSYYINKYVAQSGQTTPMVQLLDSTKSGMSCFDYANKTIYAYQFDVNKDCAKYYIQTYSPSGEKRKRIDLGMINSKFTKKGDSISDLVVFKDYIFMWSLKGKFISLQMDDEIREISLFGEDSHIRYYESKKKTNRFGCLHNYNTSEIIRYDENKKAFLKQKLLIEKNNRIQNMLVNEQGKILIETMDEINNQIKYYILPDIFE